jgi:uncharacterized membrane protein YsdA (DUF1294 family)
MMVYLLVTTISFGLAGKFFQNAEFHDHKWRYSVQFIGMFIPIVTNIAIAAVLYKD